MFNRLFISPPDGACRIIGSDRETGGACVTITVIRMQSLLKLNMLLTFYISHQVAGENINIEPPWRKRAGRSEQTDCWFGHKPTICILEADQ